MEAKKKSAIDAVYEDLEKYLSAVFYERPITTEMAAAAEVACQAWEQRSCKRRGCPYRASTCRFAAPQPEWVLYLGCTCLCELLSRPDVPKTISALDASWLRRPGHYNG